MKINYRIKEIVKQISSRFVIDGSNRNMSLFAYEGVLFAIIINLINNNNNLFASRLGASNFELSLVASLPQFVGMIVLIPGAILTDRMKNKRGMVIKSLLLLCMVYMAIGFVPMMGKYRLIIFLILISLSIGPMTMYNASWQAYFSDVISEEDRNTAFTLRTKWTFIINISICLLTGIILASATTNAGKLIFHQSFSWIGCVLIIIQVFVLKKISGGNAKSVSTIKFKELNNVILELIKNKRFLEFLGIALFFYVCWQADWSLYYIGEITYLKLNEAWLSYVNVGGAVVQFLTIGFWSRINEKHGVRFPVIIGSLALSFFPLIIIFCASLPLNKAPLVFLILTALSNFAFATITLNIFQCLLEVIPKKNKTLSIAVYSFMIALSNAVMPMAGVKLYTSLGGNLRAFRITFLILFASRIVATGLWTLRWFRLRHESK
jgi:hypothetical protein